jgi:GPH family glycoside/pentoside/hexuronide:cation symporter
MYSASSLGSEALIQGRNLWLLYFYLPPADAHREQLINPGAYAALALVITLTSSFNDPLIAYWSDRSRSRLGRRLPFILWATPFWALFGFMFFTPPHSGTAWVALYFFLVSQAYAFTSTLSGGPYEAMLPEISHESNERLGIVGMKVWFGALGGLVGLVASGVIKDNAGFRAMAFALAALALGCRYVGMIGIWRHASRTTPPAELPLRGAVTQTFRNRSFQSFLPSFVLFQLAYGLMLGMLPFFVKAFLNVSDEGTWVAGLTAVAIAVVVVSVPWHRRHARRTSKRAAYRLAMLAGAIVFPFAAVAGSVPGLPDALGIGILMGCAGFAIAGVYLFPAALTADIVDDDSMRTGMRREAMFFGAQNFVEKWVTALRDPLLIVLLTFGNTAGDTLGIRLVGPAAGLLLLLGYWLFRRYDLVDDPLTAAAPPSPPPASVAVPVPQ